MNSKVDIIIKFLPYGSVIIIITGYISMFWYYNFFGITINHYMGLSEFLIYQFNNILIFVFISIFGAFFYLFITEGDISLIANTNFKKVLKFIKAKNFFYFALITAIISIAGISFDDNGSYLFSH